MTRSTSKCYKDCGRRALYRMVAIVPALEEGGVERAHRIKQVCPACPQPKALSKKEMMDIAEEWTGKKWGTPNFIEAKTKWVEM